MIILKWTYFISVNLILIGIIYVYVNTPWAYETDLNYICNKYRQGHDIQHNLDLLSEKLNAYEIQADELCE